MRKFLFDIVSEAGWVNVEPLWRGGADLDSFVLAWDDRTIVGDRAEDGSGNYRVACYPGTAWRDGADLDSRGVRWTWCATTADALAALAAFTDGAA